MNKKLWKKQKQRLCNPLYIGITKLDFQKKQNHRYFRHKTELLNNRIIRIYLVIKITLITFIINYKTKVLTKMNKVDEIEAKIEQLEEVLEKKETKIHKSCKSWDEYSEYMKPERKQIAELSRELRLIKKPEYSELPEFGDTMTLEHFISCVDCGGFIDYDGSGNYVKDGKMSDISIYPSDVKHNKVRKDFDTIVWFNR